MFIHKGKIYCRGIENGRQYKDIVKYKPYLFAPSQSPTAEYSTIDEKPADKIEFDSIWDAKEYVKQYKEVSGFPIYGITKYQYLYIFDEFSSTDIKFNISDVSVVAMDIEWRIGSADIATAIATTPEPITAITIARNGYKDVFGCGDYSPTDETITYHKCSDEKDLLRTFLSVWTSERYNPDVITGWNTEGADIPYLIGRMIKLLGEDEAANLSPWGLIEPYTITVKGRELTSWNLKGISHLDYISVYKKFVLAPRESYRLDYIAEVELDERKVDYTSQGYSDLNDLADRNFQLFIDYNIHDTELVCRLESKLKLIELILTVAYDSGVNYNDTLGTVNQWEIIIHNHLLKKKIVSPPRKRKAFSAFVGGYVKEPIPGLYNWVVSFDLDSLYPSLFRAFNISPDTFIERLSTFPAIEELLQKADINTNGYSTTANGCYFRKDKQGFIPEIVELMYADRKKFKKLMLETKEQYEKLHDPILLEESTRLDLNQHSKKIKLNALYGASGNVNFLYFDINIAEAITTTGQLVIRWIGDRINILINKFCKTKNVNYICASDTDSLYVVLDEVVKQKFKATEDPIIITRWLDKLSEEVIRPEINKAIEELLAYLDAYENALAMKRENIAERAIWTGAKKYAMTVWNSEGIEYSEPKMKITGLEAIKSSTPAPCRDYIKTCLDLVLTKTEGELQSYIIEAKDNFNTLEPELIAFPRGITDIDKYAPGKEYKTLPIHARASLHYNRLLKEHKLQGQYEYIGNGDKMKFIYLVTPNPIQSNVIGFLDKLPKEFDLHKYIDYEQQFKSSVLGPVELITRAANWQLERKASLEDFFG